MIKNYLREKHQISNYQIAQIEFLFKTIFSEFSKIMIIGLLFHNQLEAYLFALCIMLFMRCSTGGLHFYTYFSCLSATVVYLWLAIALLPNLELSYYLQFPVLLISMLICYFVGPVVSKYRPAPSPRHFRHCRNICCIGICLYMLILYIIPSNRLLIIGLWVIILHSLQLVVAKILKKGGSPG